MFKNGMDVRYLNEIGADRKTKLREKKSSVRLISINEKRRFQNEGDTLNSLHYAFPCTLAPTP